MSYRSTTYKYALALRLYRYWHENENAAKYNNYFHTPEEALSYIDDVLEVITDELKAGNEVKLMGFGCFGIQTRKSRQGCNPQTGQTLTIPEIKYVSFRSGTFLKRAVNDDQFKTND